MQDRAAGTTSMGQSQGCPGAPSHSPGRERAGAGVGGRGGAEGLALEQWCLVKKCRAEGRIALCSIETLTWDTQKCLRTAPDFLQSSRL